LILVLRRFYHGLEDALYIFGRDVLVKQVAHGIHKHHSRFFPRTRKIDQVRMHGNLELVAIPIEPHCMKAMSKAFGITVFAALTDLCATRYWVPSHVSPLDM
jgi:hypothetical protein